MASPSYSPIWELTLTRVRLFLREPEAVFWVYGFPILMLALLGIAFRDNPNEQIAVDLVTSNTAQAAAATTQDASPGTTPLAANVQELKELLAADQRFELTVEPAEDWRKRLQAGKTDLVIEASAEDGNSSLLLWDEPRRAESRLARYAVEAALLRRASPSAQPFKISHLQEAGTRYIDFLVPGMIGMGLMGGGLWGVGFVVVDMRVRKLLKRFLATPMRRSHFLLAVMLSRLLFTVVDVIFLLGFSYLAFGVRCQGSYLDLIAAVTLGAASFAGIGLLVASRAQTIETVSGLMNLVMLPMWVLSGVFFSSERFPDAAQPLINALPLTALNQVLRGVMLEGNSVLVHWPQLALLAAYTVVTFAIALRIFRWR